MKSSLKGGFPAAIFAGLLVLLTPAASFGDESFTLRINGRSPKVPVARVKITLTLGAPLPMDDTLTKITVGIAPDDKTISLATIPPVLTVTSGPNTGDRATFIKTSPTEVVINYFPRSHFADPTLWCTPKSGMGAIVYPVNIPVSFQGPDITFYRMNAYTVGKNSPGEVGDCTNASRRVKSATVGQAAEVLVLGPDTLSATFLGRHPLDVILVLDQSGSMSGKPPANPASLENKWEILKKSIEQFVALWVAADPGPAGGGGAALDLTQDRIGVVFFSTNEEKISFMGSDFVARGMTPPPMHNWKAVADTLAPPRGPTNLTAMGKGVNAAIQEWLGIPVAQRNDATIVLMTDGLQNVDPKIKKFFDPVTMTEVDDMVLLDPTTVMEKKLSSYFIPMLTIGFTVPGSGTTEDNTLEAIAKQTAGTSRLPADSFSMAMAYASSLVDLLKGNTLSTLTQTRNTLPAGAQSNAPMSFMLDGSVRRATIVLGWEGSSQPGLNLVITAPGGGKVKPSIRQDGNGWTIQSVDIPFTGPVGDWGVQVVRGSFTKPIIVPGSPGTTPGGADQSLAHASNPSRNVAWGSELPKADSALPETALAATAQTQPAVPYHLSIYTAEGKLDYRFSFPNLNGGTGDTMTLTADVSYEGKNLTNLPDKAITLKIERPPVGLGTLLHDDKNNVSANVLGTEIAGGGDVTTPYDRKIAELAKNGKLEGNRPQELGTDFELEDNGNTGSGDTAAGDGVYSAQFADTSRPGLYRFKVTMDWNDPRTGRIHRTETIERVVKVTPDPAASQVSVTSPGPGVYLIKVTPRDKFNNYFGPSAVNPVRVTITGGGNVVSINDPEEKGDYIVRLENVPAGADPHVVISVDGKKITDDNISNLPGGPGSNTGGPMSKFAVFLHFGAAFPHSNFGNVFDPGFSFNGGLEYAVTDYFSVEGIFGAHHFENSFVGGNNVDVFQFSGNGKFYLSAPGSVRPWFNFGVGAYKFDPGSTRFGGNVGTGLQFNLTPRFALEAAYNFHAVSTTGTSTRFSTFQGGFRFRF